MTAQPRDELALRRLEIAFQQGDSEAYRVLVTPHVDTVFTLCVRMLGSRARADDAAQDALTRAFAKHATYRPGMPFRPWLLTIAANVCRSELRGPWWQRWNPLSGAEAHRQDPERLIDASDADAKVRRALLELDPLYREAVSLFHLEEMTYDEMSAITGVTVAALKQRVRRGREMLRDILTTMYPDLAVPRMDDEGSEP